ncbi:hypothetical protein [Paenibacillus durus]|nr:hypothetical protein [Paenibacillus durus]
MKPMDEKIMAMLHKTDAVPNVEQPAQTTLRGKADLSGLLVEIEGEKILFREQEWFDGRVRMTMPKTFRLMTQREAALKYPSERRPPLIYTNDDLSVNLALNHTGNVLDEADVEEFKDALAQITRSTQPIREWIGDGIRQTEEKTFGYLEFMTPALNTNIYNLLIFISLDKRALICTFNCTEWERKAWRPVALGMLDSLYASETGKGGRTE